LAGLKDDMKVPGIAVPAERAIRRLGIPHQDLDERTIQPHGVARDPRSATIGCRNATEDGDVAGRHGVRPLDPRRSDEELGAEDR
jgi:hypothetical protein